MGDVLAYLLNGRYCGQLVALENRHALLRHVQMQRELQTGR